MNADEQPRCAEPATRWVSVYFATGQLLKEEKAWTVRYCPAHLTTTYSEPLHVQATGTLDAADPEWPCGEWFCDWDRSEWSFAHRAERRR